MKITTLFSSLLLLLFMSSSCNPKLTSAAQNKDNNNIIVSSAFTQTEVPGQENGKIIDYLKLKLDVNKDLNFKTSSILYNGKKYDVTYNPRMIKINLAEGVIQKSDTKLKKNQALLTYTISGVEEQLMINNIEAKEDLYLP